MKRRIHKGYKEKDMFENPYTFIECGINTGGNKKRGIKLDVTGTWKNVTCKRCLKKIEAMNRINIDKS